MTMRRMVIAAVWCGRLARAPSRGGQRAPGGGGVGTWVTAWGTSQQALSETAITNATVRLIARVTVPGRAIRVRLDNTFSADTVRIARASIAPRIQGAQVASKISPARHVQPVRLR